jgi:hypothetical protein
VLLLVNTSDETTHRLVQGLKAVQNGNRNSRRRRRWRPIRGDSRDHITWSEGDDRRRNHRRPGRRMVTSHGRKRSDDCRRDDCSRLAETDKPADGPVAHLQGITVLRVHLVEHDTKIWKMWSPRPGKED